MRNINSQNTEITRKSGMNAEPIILIGLPRSGTTWIGKIFDSHPGTLYLHEPDSSVPMNELPLIAGSSVPVSERPAVLSVLSRTMDVRLTRVISILPQCPKSYRVPALDWLHRQLALGTKACSPFFGEFSLPDFLASHRPVRLIWKSIESIGRLALIAQVLPRARIIHILRHPGGWIASMTRGHLEGRFGSGRDEWWRWDLLEATPPAQRRGLTVSAFETMNDLQRDVWSWVLWNEYAIEASAGLTNVMTITYEQVCAAPIVESKKLFEFARLSWDRQVEDFLRKSTSTHKEQFYSLFRDPAVAANKWRCRMSASDLNIIESILSESTIGRRYLALEASAAA